MRRAMLGWMRAGSISRISAIALDPPGGDGKLGGGGGILRVADEEGAGGGQVEARAALPFADRCGMECGGGVGQRVGHLAQREA